MILYAYDFRSTRIRFSVGLLLAIFPPRVLFPAHVMGKL